MSPILLGVLPQLSINQTVSFIIDSEVDPVLLRLTQLYSARAHIMWWNLQQSVKCDLSASDKYFKVDTCKFLNFLRFILLPTGALSACAI